MNLDQLCTDLTKAVENGWKPLPTWNLEKQWSIKPSFHTKYPATEIMFTGYGGAVINAYELLHNPESTLPQAIKASYV